MANRTEYIIGRVLKNLKRIGIDDNLITQEDVLDELNQAQNQIISEIDFVKSIKITIKENQTEYLLTTDLIISNNGYPEYFEKPIDTEPKRMNVASIKVAKLPTNWTTIDSSDYNNYPISKGFDVIPEKRFIEVVNNSPNRIGKPVIGTVIDNKLRIYPTPDINFEGDEIEFIIQIKSSTQDITLVIEPELPEIYDKCLEYFVVSQFLEGDLRMQFRNEYQAEVNRLRGMESRKNHILIKPPIEGW